MSDSRERDQVIERLLRRQHQPSTVSHVCLEPETLAAWMDGRLSGRERAQVEARAAECGRCQSMLAAMIRSTPRHQRIGWWRRSAVRWIVPLTAAATAAAVWIAVDTRHRETAAPLDAAPPHTAPPPVATPKAAAAQERESPRPQRSADLRAVDRPRVKGGRGNTASAETRGVAGGKVAAAMPAQTAVAGAATPPATPSTPAAAPSIPPVSERVSVGASRKALGVAKADALLDRAAAPLAIVSPDPARRWLITGATVQHSSDGGASWQRQDVGDVPVLRAGSSPSPDVCWLAGTAGTVLLYDAGKWTRVAFPETVDLIEIRAQDGRSASVTTADGRTLATSDGGRTWR